MVSRHPAPPAPHAAAEKCAPDKVTTATSQDEARALPSESIHPGTTEGEVFEAFVPVRRARDGTWPFDERFFSPRGRELYRRLGPDESRVPADELEEAMARMTMEDEGPFVQFAVLANRVSLAVLKRDKAGALRFVRDLSALRERLARGPDDMDRRFLLPYVDLLLAKLTRLASDSITLVDPCEGWQP